MKRAIAFEFWLNVWVLTKRYPRLFPKRLAAHAAMKVQTPS